MNQSILRLLGASVILVAAFGADLRPAVAQTAPADQRAIGIAREMLAAIETGWHLSEYDRADRLRAAINIRGHAPLPVGITSNLALDRAGRRWRLDAGGDIGPLTLFAGPQRMTLYVPGVEQFARRGGTEISAIRLASEISELRGRLDEGYPFLRYLGEEPIDGARTHRIEDTPSPGVTTTFWVDAATNLPRRIASGRDGGTDMRLDFRYGSGPRPSEIESLLRSEREIRTTTTLTYDARGRVSSLHASTRLSDGSAFTSDIRLDWAPRFGAGFFDFEPPAGSSEVGFGQLVSGVALAAAGKLAALAPFLR